MLTAVLTPIGLICCLLGVVFTSFVYKKGTRIVSTVACVGMTCCLCFTASGIPNLMPSMVISKFGRYEFLSANRVCMPLALIILSFGFAALAAGKALAGGNWFGGYGVFVIACAIAAVVLHRIDDSKEADDEQIEAELRAKASMAKE